MRKARLGCFTSTGIIAALITAFFIAGSAIAGGGLMYSPGALNAKQGHVLGGVSSHAEIAGDCKLCHVAPWENATMDQRCSACHTDVVAEMSNPESMHARMAKIDPTATCRECHPEHNGEFASLTVLEGWKFPHESSGFSLKGHQLTSKNEPFLCSDCHGNDVTRFDQATCKGCHSEMNMTFMVDHLVAFGDSCLNCHDGVDKYGKSFDHNTFAFALTGKHVGLQCSKCHMLAHTVADLQAVGQTCVSCHQKNDPHKGTLGSDCASCHTPDGWKPSHFDHNRSDFKLDGAHASVACAKCHVNGVYKGTPKDCFSCHQKMDPHNGQFGTDCAKCHTPDDWQNATFDHGTTAFPLVGKHINVECKQCHKDGVYKGTPKECAACHVDIHFGQMGKDCALCHSPAAWKPIIFDHNKTGFKLTGSHLNVACGQCHKNGIFKGTPKDCFACHAKDDHHNGQFGKDCALCHNTTSWKNVSFDHSKTNFPLRGQHVNVACGACHKNNVFKGTPTDCFACHAKDDHHNGQFGKDCGSCHNPSSWTNVSFDHSKTNFPLKGLHTTVACKACHVNNVFKGTPTNCFACHAKDDHHNGQFGTNCGSCHNPTGWKNVSFDHSKTNFPLKGLHTTVACNACHVNGVFKGTPTNCFACHAKDDRHNGQLGTNCGSCHNPTGWKSVTFDHSKTAFPLVSSHTTVPCASCHKNGVYKGTPKDCFSCHASKDAHNGQFGTDCGSCHKPTKWTDVNFDHSKTAFPLVSSHTTVPCASCHKNGVYKGTPKDCFSCHASKDAHNGQFGTDCGSCHKPTKWTDVTFDHNQTAFPLVSSHKTVPCASCHKNGVYKGTPTNCFACHASKDAHNGQLGTDCGSCHKPTQWTDVTFDHSTTAFPLIGNHKTVPCASCHVNGVYKGTPTNCYACHASKDPHGGQLGTNCGSCHSPTGWTNVTFDHNTTAFPLTGKHINLACSKCHGSGQYKGLPTTCASCHAEPAFHAGAFGTDCVQCHTTSGWTPAPYANHSLYQNQTRMVNHHGATCKTCHTVNVQSYTCLQCHDSNTP